MNVTATCPKCGKEHEAQVSDNPERPCIQGDLIRLCPQCLNEGP